MKLLKLIKEAQSVLIICHKKPDGDTLGSGFALWNLCKFFGVSADIVADSDLPAHYAFIPDFDRLNVQTQKDYDLAVAVDCAEAERMGKFSGYAKSVLSVNIDHHKTNDYFCKYNYVAPELSSTCEAVYDLLKAEGLFPKGADTQILITIAYCLFIGFSTDTGHFMHSSVTAKTFRAAAELAETGIDTHGIAGNLYRSNTKQRTKLISRAIESMRFFNNDEICLVSVFLKDFAETGAVSADTEGLIDYALNLKSTRVAICATEHTDKLFKVSFRSKGLDVAAAAAVFGGGGHTRAAGCTAAGYYEDVVGKLVKAVSDLMET